MQGKITQTCVHTYTHPHAHAHAHTQTDIHLRISIQGGYWRRLVKDCLNL